MGNLPTNRIAESRLCKNCKQGIITTGIKTCAKCGRDKSILSFPHWANTLDHRRPKCKKCENAYNRGRKARDKVKRQRYILVLISRGFWTVPELLNKSGLRPKQLLFDLNRLLAKGRIVSTDGEQFRVKGKA